MNRQMSFTQYRAMDLTILLVILAASQFFIHLGVSQWFPEQLYVVSPVAAVTALVMMRWSGYAAIHACLGGVIYTALSGGTWQHFLIYGGGNLISLLALVLLRIWGKERVRQDAFRSLAFAFAVQILMQLGRAGLAALLGNAWEVCLRFLTTDSLSVLFTLFIIWIARQADGLFEDQKHYLLRIQSEQQNEGREQF